MRRTLHPHEAAVEFVPGSTVEPLDFGEIFGRNAPVEIDGGCGDGTFLAVLAAQYPERNFLGIERLARRTDAVCRRIARLGLPNARVFRVDLIYAMARLIPADQVAAVHLLFPDPWPKRRHHRRRTVTAEFISSVHLALAPGGLFHVATDHAEYFRAIQRLISPETFTPAERMALPQSKFEQQFAAAGAPIYRLLLRKVSPVR
ncbi:MAG: tRNA (guanosine(46)-N7)-methyltransferase TrmB [Verrucomicrobia bacterium]|nr:tRNA (guanosine(46)-N7)-methyltransferase TrmB [Verrucomicrobiota bacterium]